MSWNYRVVRSEEQGEVYYQIHEAYYDEPTTDTKPSRLTANAVRPGGSTLIELRKDIALMFSAFDHPPIEWSDWKDKE